MEGNIFILLFVILLYFKDLKKNVIDYLEMPLKDMYLGCVHPHHVGPWRTDKSRETTTF
jgi:hypothetical protein